MFNWKDSQVDLSFTRETRLKKRIRVNYFFMRNPHMKFQNFILINLEQTLTHGWMHRQDKAICPFSFFQSWGHNDTKEN